MSRKPPGHREECVFLATHVFFPFQVMNSATKKQNKTKQSFLIGVIWGELWFVCINIEISKLETRLLQACPCADWIESTTAKSLYAPPHQVLLPSGTLGIGRTWYGRMFLCKASCNKA